jgi:peptidyl-prolyl cis-trans isomerase D
VTGLFVLAIGGVFVFFIGLGAPLQRSATAVVQVGDAEFGFREFSRIRAQRESVFQQQLGDDFDARKMSDTLDQVAVQALVDQALLASAARDLGLRVAKSEIERYVLSASVFRDPDGNFDPEQFEQWAEYEYGNQRNFIEDQRAGMLTTKLVAMLSRLARVSDGEARDAVIARTEEIQIAYAVFDAVAPEAEFEPDPAEIQAFLETRQAEAQSLFDSSTHIYDTPEQVRARHILFRLPPDADEAATAAVRAKAQEVLDRIQQGEDMATLAEEFSADPGSQAKGGDLGFFGRGQMVKEFEDNAFALEPGAMSDLVKTSYGFHIIRSEERKEAQSRGFEEVKEELASQILVTERARTENVTAAEKLAEAVRGGTSLEQAARDAELTLERSGRLRRRPDGYVPGLGAAQELMATAFSLERGQSSARVFEVENKLALVQLLERFEPEESAILAAIDAERASLISRKRQSYVSAWLDQRRADLVADGRLIVNMDLIKGS